MDALDEEILSDDDFSNSDLDSDIVVENKHDTCTEESGLSSDEKESSDQNYLGKDGTKWKARMPSSNSRTRSHNLVTHLPGVKGVAKNSKSIIDSWQLFFPDEVISEIVNFTNIKIQKVREHFARVRDAKDTDIIEMKAIIGLLYLSGSLRSSHQNLCDLWRTDGLGVDYFHATMNIRRFRFILQCLRFDDVNSRNT
ncbi:piggyBac transposable element-derived protein 4-like, partial [Aphis craccivora]